MQIRAFTHPFLYARWKKFLRLKNAIIDSTDDEKRPYGYRRVFRGQKRIWKWHSGSWNGDWYLFLECVLTDIYGKEELEKVNNLYELFPDPKELPDNDDYLQV